MIKQLLINGEGNRYTLSNRARQAIAFQYITDTKTLRLIDTYNNIALDLTANGDHSLTSSAMQKIWQYLEPKVDNKVGGAFKFRGTVNALSDVIDPKPGDVYQIKVTNAQYDPYTGDVIPSSIADNDKEFAWAEHEDGTGQWIELGFNYEGNAVTEQWVKEFFVGKFQSKEVLSGIIKHTQLSTTLQTRDQAIEEHNELLNTISSTAQDLYNYIDQQTSSTEDTISTVSSTIMDYVNNTVSTSIINYINNKIDETNTNLNNLSTTVIQNTSYLSTTIDDLSAYTVQQNNNLSALINNKIDSLSTTVNGKIITLTNTFENKIYTLSTNFNNKIISLSTLFDHKINSLGEDLTDQINNLNDIVIERDNVLSTSINNLTLLVNEKDSALSSAIDNLSVDFNTKINDLSIYIDEKDTILSSAINNLSIQMNDRYEELIAKHNKDLTFIQYDDEGNIIIS